MKTTSRSLLYSLFSLKNSIHILQLNLIKKLSVDICLKIYIYFNQIELLISDTRRILYLFVSYEVNVFWILIKMSYESTNNFYSNNNIRSQQIIDSNFYNRPPSQSPMTNRYQSYPLSSSHQTVSFSFFQSQKNLIKIFSFHLMILMNHVQVVTIHHILVLTNISSVHQGQIIMAKIILR
jgi:hypothetical protein